MLTTITRVYETHFTSGRRGCFMADLACGHKAGAKGTIYAYICGGCGLEQPGVVNDYTCAECGHRSMRVRELPEPRLHTQPGDEHNCTTCDKEARELNALPDLVARSIYSRARPFMGGYSVTFYARDESSPTGVRAIGGVTLTTDVEAELDRLGACFPLSPTEGLGA